MSDCQISLIYAEMDRNTGLYKVMLLMKPMLFSFYVSTREQGKMLGPLQNKYLVLQVIIDILHIISLLSNVS